MRRITIRKINNNNGYADNIDYIWKNNILNLRYPIQYISIITNLIPTKITLYGLLFLFVKDDLSNHKCAKSREMQREKLTPLYTCYITGNIRYLYDVTLMAMHSLGQTLHQTLAVPKLLDYDLR